MSMSFKQMQIIFRFVLVLTIAINQFAAVFLATPPVAQAAPLFSTPATLYGNAIPLVPTAYSSSIVGSRTGIAGLCTGLTCFVTNTANVVNANTSDAGNLTILAAIAGTVRMSVNAGQTIPAGYKAGFRLNTGAGLLDLSLLGSVHIKTYLAGVLREDISNPALLELSLFGAGSDNNISFVTTQSFDEIQLEINTLVGAGINWNVLYALVQQPFTVSTAPGGITNGLVSWVRADAGISGADGAAVAAWANQVPTGYDYTQATGTAQPTYYSTSAAKLVNFNPVVDFDGTGDFLRNTTQLMPSSSAYTFMTVGIDDSTDTAYRNLFSSEALNDYFSLYKQGGAPGDNGWVPYAIGGQSRSAPLLGDRGSMGKGTKYSAAGGANGYWNGTNFASDSRTQRAQPQIVGFNSLNSAASDPFYTWTDGYKENPNWSPIVDGLSYRNQFFSQTSIGADINVKFWQGRVPEFLVFNRALTDAEMQQVNTYLAIKYGVTLGQGNGAVGANGNNVNYIASDGTTSLWDAATNATYKNNITGIGRDDDSTLNQKQSKSVNANGLVTIGLGTIAATNAANSNSFAANKSFEVFGDDNGSIASWASLANVTPGDLRIAREWKVQETGTVGAVKISVPDDSTVGTAPELPNEPPLGKVMLLVDADGNFTSGATKVPMTLVGTNWQANVDFTASTGYYFTIASDFTPPDITSITSTTANGTYGIGANVNVTVALSEQVQAGSTLSLVLNSGATINLTCASSPCSTLSGSYTVASGQNSADLSVSSVTGSLTDVTGNVNTDPNLPTGQNLGDNSAIVIDSGAPDTNLTATPALVTNSTSAAFSFAGNDTLTLPANLTFACSLDGAAFVACSSPKSYTGLAAGSHTFEVRAADTVGNIDATPAPFSWQIDTTAPSAPVVSSPASGSSTNDTTPTVTGTGTAGDTITVKDEGGATLCTTTVAVGGGWSCTSSALTAGAHTLSVTATDPAGNVSPITNVPFTVDTTAPSAPAVSSPASGSTINDATPDVTGTGATAGDLIMVTDENGIVLCTTIVVANGSWSCTSSTLTSGAHTLRVTASDPAGNISSITSVPFTVDTTAPSALVVSSPASGSSTKDATPDVTGSGATAGDTITVKNEGGTTLCTVTVPVGGSWSCTSSTLADGAHTLSVTATDPAGNVSPITSVPFTVDTTAPSAPTVTTPVSGSTITDATPDVTGSGATAGDTITVKDESGTTLCTAIVAVGGSWSCTSSTLADGPHTLSVTATDPAGNVSPITSVPFTVDATAPSAPTVATPVSGSTITDATPDVTGSGATAGDTITVKDESGTTLCTAIVAVGGSWSCTSSTLADGAHTLSVTATDPAGNVSPITSVPFTVDATAPSAPTVTSPSTGGIISDTTPTVAGIGTAGDTITVKDEGGATLCTAIVAVGGSWSCTSSSLADGAHTLSVTATDPAGNVSPATSVPFTVDSSAVSTPAILSPASGSSTNDTTPTVIGLATAGTTIVVTDENSAPICTTLTDPNGDWSCTFTTPLSEASHTFSAVATNSSGTPSTAATSTFTVDTTAPSAPTVNSPASGSSTKDATPNVTGSGATAGDTITVKDEGGTTLCTAIVAVGGSWSCTSSTLADGAHTLSVTATDPAGNVSPITSVPFTVDTTAPSAPTVSTPVSGSTITDATPDVTGSGATAGDTITVKNEGGTTLCTVTVPVGGSWSCTSSTLADGAHTLSVTATDPTGNVSPITNVPFTVDTTAPSAPMVTAPVSGSTITDATPDVTGSGATAGNTITVKDEGGTTLCTVTVPVGGSWSCTSSSLADGAHTLSVTATDPAGNVSPITSVPFTVDTTAPNAPTVTAPVSGSTITDATPDMTGSGATAGNTITVKDEAGNTLCTAIVAVGGSWSCTSSTLADGAHTLSVTATDPAGNVSPITNVPFTVDTTAPSAPTVTSPVSGSTITDATPDVTGSGATAGNTITVKDEGGNTLCTAIVPVGGSWSCTSSSLADGAHTLSVTATDPAGNVSPITSVPFTVDATAPSAPTVTSPASGSTINDTTPTIVGTAEANSTVTIRDAGGTVVCTIAASGTGAYSCTTSVLTQASLPLSVTATDAAGNVSSPTSLPLTLDTTAPSAPSVTSPASGSTITDATPDVTGSGATTGDMITVKDEGGTTLCTVIVPVGGSWSCTSSSLADGAHTLSVTATDPAGNVSPITSVPFTVDTTAPSAPAVTAPVSGSSTKDATPDVTGSGATAGNMITVKDEAGNILCTAIVAVGGSWSCTSSSLADGAHTLSVTSTDPAGNVSSITSVPLTVDTTAPSAPAVTSPASGGVMSDTTPTVAGNGTAGDSITVKDETGATVCTTTVKSDGTWACTVTTPLADGAHTFSVTATDPAGNTSSIGTTPFTIDPTAVSTPAITSPAPGSFSTSNPTFTGTADPDATVTVLDGSTPICTATADASGNWQCTPTTPLSEGAHTISATATNPSGTTSTPATISITVDTIAPAAPTVVSPTTGSATPTFTGTAEPGSTVTVKENGTTICTATADASGNWQCTPTTSLASGSHTIEVVVTDQAGNVSQPTTITLTVAVKYFIYVPVSLR